MKKVISILKQNQELVVMVTSFGLGLIVFAIMVYKVYNNSMY